MSNPPSNNRSLTVDLGGVLIYGIALLVIVLLFLLLLQFGVAKLSAHTILWLLSAACFLIAFLGGGRYNWVAGGLMFAALAQIV